MKQPRTSRIGGAIWDETSFGLFTNEFQLIKEVKIKTPKSRQDFTAGIVEAVERLLKNRHSAQKYSHPNVHSFSIGALARCGGVWPLILAAVEIGSNWAGIRHIKHWNREFQV